MNLDLLIGIGIGLTAWLGICFLLSRFLHWHDLSQFYSLKEPFQGRRWYFQSAGFRPFGNYSCSLTIGANSTGVYFSVWLIFRPWHPPLFIPWSDISITEEKFWRMNITVLQIAKCPGQKIYLTPKLGNKLLSAKCPE